MRWLVGVCAAILFACGVVIAIDARDKGPALRPDPPIESTPMSTRSAAPTLTDPPSTTATSITSLQTTVAELPTLRTVEEVQAVMREFDRLDGDANRVLADPARIDEIEAIRRRMFFTETYAQAVIAVDREGDAIGQYRSPPGDPVTRVSNLLHREPGCVSFVGERGYEAVFVEDVPDERIFATLRSSVSGKVWKIAALTNENNRPKRDDALCTG